MRTDRQIPFTVLFRPSELEQLQQVAGTLKDENGKTISAGRFIRQAAIEKAAQIASQPTTTQSTN